MNEITGQLAGIEARNGGWFAVAIQEQGKDWPLKLSTKKGELVQMAQQLMGQMVTAGYNEQESTNINPHNNQPYINRYLEALSLAGMNGQQPQQMAQQPQQMVQQQPIQMQPQQVMQQPMQVQQQPQVQPIVQQRQSEAERELKIHRQAACKVAVQLLPHILKEGEVATLSGLLRISESLVQYFGQGVQWTVQAEQPQQQTMQADPGPQQGDPGGGFAQPLDPYGDDIPFAPTIY